MIRRGIAVALGFLLVGLLIKGYLGGSRLGDESRSRHAAEDVTDPLGETVKSVVYLDQGWSPEDSQRFYFTSQGSQILPYNWFLVLEQPDNSKPFRDSQNILKLRYLPQRPDALNPDGLPVGFAKDQGRDRAWFGFTCAACHTTQVDYKGVGYRIDGGPALGDVQGLLGSIVAALKATRDQEEKFSRFAAKVLGDANNVARRDALKAELTLVIDRREGYNQRNFPAEIAAGNGRVDAFGAILNEVFHHLVKPEDLASPTTNTRPANAPVSYPCLWDTPQHDKVQWIGNAANGGLLDVGSLGRNVGEVLGVFADFEIPEHPSVLGYSSSVRVANLRAIETWLTTLWSPQWPSDFPALDATKKQQGRRLYDQKCLECHKLIDRKAPDRAVKAVMQATGTDPLTAANFWGRTGSSGKLEGTFLKVYPSFAGRFGAAASADAALVNAVIGTIIGSTSAAPEDALTKIELGVGRRAQMAEAPVVGAEYKARPLNGIWATAPYLHNGSVPNLYQLLLPADKRDKSFFVGSRKFDPVHVGFESQNPVFFRYRARNDDGQPVPGNSNAGHEYGADLQEDERWQLIEYLKSL